MKKAGQIVLFQFPQTDLGAGKLRPALLLGRLLGEFDDWLVCMVSSQVHHYVAGFDEVLNEGDPDFKESGLKGASLIRTGRIAVVSSEVLLGSIGQISDERLNRIKQRLSDWLRAK